MSYDHWCSIYPSFAAKQLNHQSGHLLQQIQGILPRSWLSLWLSVIFPVNLSLFYAHIITYINVRVMQSWVWDALYTVNVLTCKASFPALDRILVVLAQNLRHTQNQLHHFVPAQTPDILTSKHKWEKWWNWWSFSGSPCAKAASRELPVACGVRARQTSYN